MLVATPGETLSDGTPCKVQSVVRVSDSADLLDCAPLDYGVGVCARHDEDPPSIHCSGEDPPAWCLDAWCYVDEEKCRSSNLKYYASSTFHSRFYSYQACGHATNTEESYEELGNKVLIKGKTLRVAMPEVKYPYMYLPDYTLEDGTYGYGDPETLSVEGRGANYTGVAVEYLRSLAAAYEFNLDFTFISRGNVNRNIVGSNNNRYNGSSWTGCVQDVAQGLVDVCVGDYWTDAKRALIAPFSLPFFGEWAHTYLLAHVPFFV